MLAYWAGGPRADRGTTEAAIQFEPRRWQIQIKIKSAADWRNIEGNQ